jgi:hypothetical protein
MRTRYTWIHMEESVMLEPPRPFARSVKMFGRFSFGSSKMCSNHGPDAGHPFQVFMLLSLLRRMLWFHHRFLPRRFQFTVIVRWCIICSLIKILSVIHKPVRYSVGVFVRSAPTHDTLAICKLCSRCAFYYRGGFHYLCVKIMKHRTTST